MGCPGCRRGVSTQVSAGGAANQRVEERVRVNRFCENIATLAANELNAAIPLTTKCWLPIGRKDGVVNTRPLMHREHDRFRFC